MNKKKIYSLFLERERELIYKNTKTYKKEKNSVEINSI